MVKKETEMSNPLPPLTLREKDYLQKRKDPSTYKVQGLIFYLINSKGKASINTVAYYTKLPLIDVVKIMKNMVASGKIQKDQLNR